MPYRYASRCPSSGCLKDLSRTLKPLTDQYSELPEWLRGIIDRKEKEKETDPEDWRMYAIYECGRCNVVWSQTKNHSIGVSAHLEGFHFTDPDQLDPIPVDIHPVDPPRTKVRCTGKQRGGRRR